MRPTLLRTLAVVASFAALAAALNGCELIVALDRSAVDAGADDACAICADTGDDSDDGASDGASDASEGDASADAGDGD